MSDRTTPRRSRTARSREAILQAAVDLTAERGYAAVSMEAIATRARVGKPTLYRWWPSKGAVFLDALLDRVVPSIEQPDTGDLVHDLRSWVHHFLELFSDPLLRQLVIGVLGAAQSDPELATMIRERIHLPLRARNQQRIIAGQQAGELSPIDPDVLEDLLIAPLWMRLLVSGDPLTPEYADAVVSAVLNHAPP